ASRLTVSLNEFAPIVDNFSKIVLTTSNRISCLRVHLFQRCSMFEYYAAILDEPLFQAAELRADGMGWDTVARDLNMTVREIRGRAFDNHKRSRRSLGDAESEVIRNAGRESINVLRVSMRNKLDPHLAVGCATTLNRALLAGLRHTPMAQRPKNATLTDPFGE